MKSLLLSFALCFALIGSANAQITTEKGSKSDATFLKMRKLDVLIKILPLALKKPQLDELLSSIEKARVIQKEALQKEDEVMARLDPDLDKAVTDGVEKGVYPSKSLQDSITKATRSMSTSRVLASLKMVDMIMVAIDKVFDAGQKKVKAGTFDPKYMDPTGQLDFKEKDKIRFFVKEVFLDPMSYNVLTDLLSKAPEK